MAGNSVLGALRHAWLTLQPLHAPMAMMGGLALAAWEHVRATQDVDLLVGVAHSRVPELIDQLQPAGFRPKRSPPLLTLGNLRLLQFIYQPAETYLDLQVDLLIADSEYEHVALSRRIAARLPGLDIEIAVLTCEDLILHKLLAGRILDRADAAALLVANRPRLDTDYLLHWSNTLGLTTEMSEVWQTAFPGQRPPSL